jgi:orotidine-5'-phosphate decarboxylase
MAERNFTELLKSQWAQGKFLCVGLDPDYEKIPESARVGGVTETLIAFNRAVIDATKDIVCAYKPNAAFYEVHGDEGMAALRETILYAHDQAPEVPIIYDAKRGDIGNTNEYYARAAFDHLHADAITLHPYTGSEGLAAFLSRPDKGLFILCRTSNPGAREFQDLAIDGEPLYMHVARTVTGKWNAKANCGLVVGATYPDEMKQIRAVAPELPFLVPGTGAQGGDLEKSVVAAKDAHGTGFIISTSRAIIYASNGPDHMDAMRTKAQEFDGAIRAAALE